MRIWECRLGKCYFGVVDASTILSGPLFLTAKCHGKNPDGQGWSFFVPFAATYYSPLDGLDSWNGVRRILFLMGRYAIFFSIKGEKEILSFIIILSAVNLILAVSFIAISVFGKMLTGLLKLIDFCICGIFAMMYNIAYISMLQVKVDLNYQGRIFGIIQALATFFMPLGALGFSILPLKCESFYIIGIIMVAVSIGSVFLIRVRKQ